MEEINDTRLKEIQELSNTIQDLDAKVNIEEVIKNNVSIFEHEKIKYRLRKLTFEEKLELINFKGKKYLELVKNKEYLFEKEWIKIYKEREIDIEYKEKQIKLLSSQIKNWQLKLAVVNLPEEIKEVEQEITELRKKQIDYHIEISELMKYSIENKLNYLVQIYTLSIILEKQVEKEKYERVFKTFEELEKNTNNDLLAKATRIASIFMFLPEGDSL